MVPPVEAQRLAAQMQIPTAVLDDIKIGHLELDNGEVVLERIDSEDAIITRTWDPKTGKRRRYHGIKAGKVGGFAPTIREGEQIDKEQAHGEGGSTYLLKDKKTGQRRQVLKVGKVPSLARVVPVRGADEERVPVRPSLGADDDGK